MRGLRLQETVPKARRIRSGIVRSSITGYRIVRNATASRRACRPVVTRPLRVIENVKCFGSELHRNRFVNSEVLKQRHVKVQSAGIIQKVSARVAKG